MAEKFLNYFNILFIVLFFPSFVTGVFLPNLICGLFIIFNLIFNFKKIKELFFEYYKATYLFTFFYLLLLFSSILSRNVNHSLETSLLYFLFSVYTLSIVILFKKNIKFRKIFFLCGITTCIILSIDAIYELYNGSNLLGYSSVDGRIAGLFGERWLIGRFLIYILPVIIGLYFLDYNNLSNYKFIFYCAIILTSIIIIFSGERAAFLMFIIYSLMILAFFIKKLPAPKIMIILLLLSSFLILPFLFLESSERIKDNFILYLTSTDLNKNPYYSMFYTSWKMFLDNPFFGIGPNNYRFICSDTSYLVSIKSCNTHPHSITFQLLAEIGIFGFICVFSVFGYFLYKSFILALSNNYSNKALGFYSLQCSVLIYLFPFMITGNFFLSWYGFIFYLPIALYIVYTGNKKLID